MKVKLLFFMLCFSVLSWAQETLSLQEAIDYAFENNYNVKSANLDIDIAQQQVRETIAQGLPQITGNVNYDYYIKQPVSLLPAAAFDPFNQIRDLDQYYDGITANPANPIPASPEGFVPLTFGTKHNFSAGAQWNQLLFSGSYLVGLQSAKAFKEISILGKEKSEASIQEAVINGYAAVLVADENVKVQQKNMEVANRNVFEIQEIYKAGFAEEQSVDQLRFSQKQLETSYNFAKRQKEIALSALKYILGMQQETELSLSSKVEEVVNEDLSLLDDVESGELENHIDYRLAQNQVKTSELQVKYQKTFALPTLSAFLSHTYNEAGNEFVLFNDNKNSFQSTLLGVRMNVPIFSGFARSARTQQAELNLEKAQLMLDNTKQQLMQKATQAKEEYDNAMDNYNTAQELVELSQSIYDKEKVKFFEGISTSTELTTAENQLYQSENQYIQSILQLVAAKTALNQALGNY